MITSTLFSFRGLALAVALTAGVTAAGNADAMSRKDKNTLVGAAMTSVAGTRTAATTTAAGADPQGIARARRAKPAYPAPGCPLGGCAARAMR
ncbi:hypothetical protein ACIGEO_03330 [Stenotrophomonas bentonitica]|uniref:hypothetical protein n=1 Tax=Stenotrophomonas bentonitica TaxID=1450134 RepID=UPI0037D7AED5